MSTKKPVYYIHSKRKWTDDGNCYMEDVMKNKLFPTRADKLKMETKTGIKFSIIDTKMKTIRAQWKKEKIMVPLEVKKAVIQRSAAQYFLNIISMEECMKLYDTMMKQEVYNEIINDEHINLLLPKQQLQKMIGFSTGHDGPYFVKWLSCLITKTDPSSVNDGRLRLWRNSSVYFDVKQQINKTCEDYEVPSFHIYKHHIVLRTKADDLPVLSSGSMEGSHLCDTIGCVLKEHIVLEPHEINISRRDCGGIKLSIIPATKTSPPQIRKATPCRH
ncbi:unnamed protein product, partial [Adineta steineri]